MCRGTTSRTHRTPRSAERVTNEAAAQPHRPTSGRPSGMSRRPTPARSRIHPESTAPNESSLRLVERGRRARSSPVRSRGRSGRTPGTDLLVGQTASSRSAPTDRLARLRHSRIDRPSSADPLGDVLGSTEIVARERRACVDGVGEIEDDVVGDELEWSAEGGADHRAILPSHGCSPVSGRSPTVNARGDDPRAGAGVIDHSAVSR